MAPRTCPEMAQARFYVLQGGLSAAEAARKLGLHPTSIRKTAWYRAFVAECKAAKATAPSPATCLSSPPSGSKR
jgi:hypothetical protein